MILNRQAFSRITFIAAALTFAGAAPLRAHCDALDGPVVKAARSALERGDVRLALVWVLEPSEPEVRDAFQRTVAVRALGPQATELADRYFFETLVRLHRAGEGAAYSGLKPAGMDPGPAVRSADAAVDGGSLKPVLTLVLGAAEQGLRERFAHVTHTAHASSADVAAGRARVKAYVEFVHYVENVYHATQAAAHGHSPDVTVKQP